jgi:hypothetical protein
MKTTRPGTLPLARSERLVIKEVAGETLVYDLDNHKAHCLSPAAAFVWKKCDGSTAVDDLERSLLEEYGYPAKVDAAGFALRQLEKAGLVALPPAVAARGGSMTRRDMLKALGCVAASLPLVTSIVAPTPAQAATLKGTGAACNDGIECSSGFCAGGYCT